MKKILVLLMSVLLIAGLAGCGTKAKPDEAAKIYYDVLIKGDNSEKEKVKMTKKDIKEFEKSFDESFITSFKSGFASLSSVSDDQAKSVLTAVKSALSKTSAKTKLVSEKKNEAVVEYSIKGVSLQDVTSDMQSDLTKLISDNPDLSSDPNKLMGEILKLLEGKLKKPKVSEKATDVKVSLVKKNGQWQPKNPEEFVKVYSAAFKMN